MTQRKPIVGGNWKMNTNRGIASELARGVVDGLLHTDGVETVLFPPFPYLLLVRSILRDRGSSIKLGAQDAYPQPDGAFTGEVSIAMLKDCGVQVVLCGHSERRHVLGEKDEFINAKVRAVLEAGLECILCVGETLDERLAGHQDIVTTRQLKTALAEIPGDWLARLTIAYEPVWAIGTGKVATPDDAQAAHKQIREFVGHLYGGEIAARVRIQYGGSLKPGNAADLFAQGDIDGGLIGGASLSAGDFVTICKAAAASARARR
ncbi:MAG: triose-phosphate isomerase [Phycisphaerales bacterium]|nr:triose-phosphate isomerase [Phycisphaerales bacterium]